MNVPIGTSTAVPSDEGDWEFVFAGSQLVLATTEGDSLVLDCLVGGDPAEPSPPTKVPFTLRAQRSGRPWAEPIPREVRGWLENGAPIDIVLTERHGERIAYLAAPGAQIALQLRPVGPSHDAGPP